MKKKTEKKKKKKKSICDLCNTEAENETEIIIF